MKAAIRTRIAATRATDMQKDSLEAMIDEFREAMVMFNGVVDHLKNAKLKVEVESIADDSELAPDLIKNVVGNFRPGRKVNKENGE